MNGYITQGQRDPYRAIISGITSEAISGVRAVGYDQSGQIRIAMASVSGRMPAIGIVTGGFLSGVRADVYLEGFLQFTSGLADYSGYLNRFAWVGRSGSIVSISGSFSSGGFISGDIGQILGVIANSGAILMRLNSLAWSGGPFGIAKGELT